MIWLENNERVNNVWLFKLSLFFYLGTVLLSVSEKCNRTTVMILLIYLSAFKAWVAF